MQISAKLLESDKKTEINWYEVTIDGHVSVYGYAYNTNQLLDGDGYPYDTKSYIDDAVQYTIEQQIGGNNE